MMQSYSQREIDRELVKFDEKLDINWTEGVLFGTTSSIYKEQAAVTEATY